MSEALGDKQNRDTYLQEENAYFAQEKRKARALRKVVHLEVRRTLAAVERRNRMKVK